MIWIGFAINFPLSVLTLVFVPTLDEFRCCGYLRPQGPATCRIAVPASAAVGASQMSLN
jgi:hypothetical protein